jgi:Collagen triple helix repeat (20 copies).
MPNLPISQLPLATSGQPESWMAIVNYDVDPSGTTNKIYFSSLTEQFSGSTGTSGTSGTSGVDGTSGTSGIDGTSGTSGVDGTSGTSGSSGTDGTSGTSGSSGTNGTSGSSGTNGTSGSSGTNGTSGTSGISGLSGTTGSWTVTPGTNNYSFTVDINNTYNLWALANIPNGIIVYNATVSVSNSNVPVIGVQYAWNYTGGGSPILFTSIPAQIIGTAGAISTDSTVVTSTNTFVFGIQNNTASGITVNYGYLKIS